MAWTRSDWPTVLRDPSVVASPLDKRIAFLQSKNLTQDEIDESFTRAGDPPQTTAPAVTAASHGQYRYQSQPPARRPAGYGYDHQAGPWSHPPPE